MIVTIHQWLSEVWDGEACLWGFNKTSNTNQMMNNNLHSTFCRLNFAKETRDSWIQFDWERCEPLMSVNISFVREGGTAPRCRTPWTHRLTWSKLILDPRWLTPTSVDSSSLVSPRFQAVLCILNSLWWAEDLLNMVSMIQNPPSTPCSTPTPSRRSRDEVEMWDGETEAEVGKVNQENHLKRNQESHESVDQFYLHHSLNNFNVSLRSVILVVDVYFSKRFGHHKFLIPTQSKQTYYCHFMICLSV